jgi:SPP1 gp7 family putative phage head morphogenesis protein
MKVSKRDAMVTIATRHQVFVERLKTGEVGKFDEFLREMDQVIRKELSQGELTDLARGRLEAQLAHVDAQLAQIQDRYWQRLKGDLADIATYEAGFEQRTLAKVIASDSAFEAVLPSDMQIQAAVFTQPLSVRGPAGGNLLEPFIKNWSKVERDAYTGVIRRGYFQGETNAQMVRAIRGTRAARYTDGLLNLTQRHATTMVRTSVQQAASQARMETWKANPDIVKGYRWVATLDSRTCAVCRPMDGSVFKMGKGPLPPIHPQCRCTTVAELPSEFDFLDKGATRASVNGPVDQGLTYYTWLKTQPDAFIREVLGPNRAQLFLKGGLSAERFSALQLDRNFSPLTLQEMRSIEPLAFSKAGLD